MDSVELDPAQEVTVDVVAGTITSRVGTAPVQLPAGARSQLLDGTWHVVGTLLEARAQIAATAAQLPYTTDFAD
jgi:3-isopropylmalate dehydratase small subunit